MEEAEMVTLNTTAKLTPLGFKMSLQQLETNLTLLCALDLDQHGFSPEEYAEWFAWGSLLGSSAFRMARRLKLSTQGALAIPGVRMFTSKDRAKHSHQC